MSEDNARLERIRELRQSIMDSPPRGDYPDDPRWQELDELLEQFKQNGNADREAAAEQETRDGK